mmetsp:Transcript_44398/g.65083  ORF Transcript_44398/g.65083 Transcript_44398/m.65083 type:complete len:93 (+) Transcript_44398:447-725(+)
MSKSLRCTSWLKLCPTHVPFQGAACHKHSAAAPTCVMSQSCSSVIKTSIQKKALRTQHGLARDGQNVDIVSLTFCLSGSPRDLTFPTDHTQC